MIYGIHPQWHQAPLEYRYALDGAAMWLCQTPCIASLCNETSLAMDVIQRFPLQSKLPDAQALLWVEPLSLTWQDQLQMITTRLSLGNLLVIVASTPLARLIPERHAWSTRTLGMSWRGLSHLKNGLCTHGFHVIETVGIHSLWAMAASLVGQMTLKLGAAHARDQWEFRARRWYTTSGWMIPATVVLLKTQRTPTYETR